MFNNFTLRDRIFLISSILILVAIALIWIFIKPRYQSTVVDERTTIVSQLQEYSLRQADNSIRNWLNSVNRLSEDLSVSPEKTAELVNKAINYTPGLMRAVITDPQTNAEIELTKRIYNDLTYPTENLQWINSRLDETISVSWVKDESQQADFLITEKAYQIGSNIFMLRLFFNAQPLSNNLLDIPLSGENYVTISDPNTNSIFSHIDFTFPPDLIGESSFSNQKIIHVNNKNWYVLSSRFETIPFWHLIAVNEGFILEPVNKLLTFSYITAAIVLLLMFCFSWYVSLHVNKPIKLLLQDVDYLSKLDFDHRIKEVPLPEFQPMHDTLENIRIKLQRYQKINVEKIILEEWKNRYMVTYSEDLIGSIGEDGTFTFLNNQLQTFINKLKLNPNTTTLDEIKNHADITISDSSQSIHYPEPFTIKVDQAEVTHYIDTDNTSYYQYQYISIFNESDRQIGAYVIIHDITENRILDVKRNDMINIIVHELKNPITGIVGLSELILNSESMSSDEIKVLTTEINNSGERMDTLVNRFLDVQKLEAGKTNLDIDKIDFKHLLKEVSKLSKPLLTSKDLRLQVNESGADFYIEADYNLVFDAVQNLLSNAVKYGEADREIRFDIAADEEHLTFSITDFGFGISVEDQPKVFEKFYRVKSNPKAAKEKGTGLGLPYVKEIVQKHNGEISLESNPEIGTKFTLIFPRKFSEKA